MAGIQLIKEALDPSEMRPENTWYLRVRAESSEPGLDSNIFVYHVHDQQSGYSGDVFECIASILQMQDIDVGTFSFKVTNVPELAVGTYTYLGSRPDYYDSPVYARVGDEVTLNGSVIEGSGTVCTLIATEGGLYWAFENMLDWTDINEGTNTLMYSPTLFTSASAARLPDDQLVLWENDESPVFTDQVYTTSPIPAPYYRLNLLECFFVTPEEVEDAWNIIVSDTRRLIISHREQLAAQLEQVATIDP